MDLLGQLRWAIAPDPGRSTALLWGGMAVFLAGAAAIATEMSAALNFLVYLAMVAGWIAGACGAVGYVRWLLRRNREEAKKP